MKAGLKAFWTCKKKWNSFFLNRFVQIALKLINSIRRIIYLRIISMQGGRTHCPSRFFWSFPDIQLRWFPWTRLRARWRSTPLTAHKQHENFRKYAFYVSKRQLDLWGKQAQWMRMTDFHRIWLHETKMTRKPPIKTNQSKINPKDVGLIPQLTKTERQILVNDFTGAEPLWQSDEG